MKMTCLIVALLLQITAFTQYNGKETALGIRAGGSAGITFKKFTSGHLAFEGILAKDFDKNDGGIFATALVQNNAPLAGKRFSAIIGAGPSYHFERKSLGASAIIGFDWRVFTSPINFQLDWIPSAYFNSDDHFTWTNVAVSARYILNHKKVYSTK